MDQFEYIVVGAGSAGCVLANRLSANPAHKVLLLEAGGKDLSPWLHIPVGYFKTMHNPAFDWCYMTEPDPGIANRQLQWPRGKVLGGSSALNGLLYVRGQPEDYNRWVELGNPGWTYDEVLPYFKKSEDNSRGADEFHAVGGPQKQAATEIGIPLNEDYNGSQQEGVSYFQQTAHKGFRWSTAKSFLRPAIGRANLSVVTRAQVTSLVFDGKRVTGVNYRRGHESSTASASAEVILSAGAINSPQILQNSGVGDPAWLQRAGIETRHALPGVGKNLQDHLQIRLVFKTNKRTLNDELNNPLKRMMVGMQYMLTRTGPLTLAASQVAIFTRSGDDVERPDIQFHMQPLSADKPGDGVHPFSAFTSSVCQLRPFSRGEVVVETSDPMTYPKIYPNYLSDERDCAVAIRSIKVARRIAEAPALRNCVIDEYVPGREFQSDVELLDAARRYSQTIYHPTSTCKRGNDDAAVVDHQLRVHGIEGLRVADASIMPEIVSGNTNAPTIMIAEKAADMILGKKS
ncbi:MAG: GMC family oxidoreductase N-terminal domain-containing protein [Gammaproteobacteria bacterium]